MAGSFGYEEGHYDVSKACGERVLFPAVRGTGADDVVVAPGFSCRHHSADLCNRAAPAHDGVAGDSGVKQSPIDPPLSLARRGWLLSRF
jgi:hypothetical protein